MISNSNKDIYGRCGLFLFLALATTTLRPQPALAQTGPTSWAGQITCQLDDQDATYSRHEIQTWKLIGGPPDPQPGIPHYPAIWSASGQGALQRVRGNETVNMQWTTSVPSANAMIAIFVRASDQKLIIKTWHGQLTVPNAVNGTKQVTQNGVTEPPSSFSHAAWEWSFPHIEVDASGSVVTGSTTSQADAGSAELVHHFGGVPPNTTCQWQLASGGAAVPVATPPVQGTVTALPQQPVTGIALPSSGTPPVQGTVTALPQQPVTGIALPSSGTPPVQGTVTALPQQPAIGIALPSSGTPTVQGTVTALPQQPAIGIALPSSGTPTGTVTALPGLQNTVKNASLTPQLVQVTPPATQQTAGGPGPTVSVKLLGQNTGFQNGVSTVTFTASTSSPTAAQQQAVMTALHKASESYTQLLQSTQLALTSPPTRPSTLQVSSFQVSSATSAVAQVVIDPAAYGPYDVAVTTPLPNGKGPEVASMTAGFTVAPASTVPAASGNYLITMTGLLCMNPTVDDQLNRDGKGDEIYGAAFVRQYNRTTGQLTNSRNAKTWVYGDTNGFVDAQGNPTRKQAGSLSPLGGIDKNDFIPDQSTAESTVNPLSVHPDLFPMTLWRGTMTDGVEALIISPTVWEYDGEPSLFTNWVQNQQNLNSTLLYTQKVQDVIKSAGLSQLTLGGGEAVAQFTNPDLAVIDATIGLPPIQLLFSSGQDRPIGLGANASQSTYLPNTAVVLTREIIEQHTQPSSGTPGVTQSGSLAVIFADTVIDGAGSIIGPKRFASYMMFIQIEKL